MMPIKSGNILRLLAVVAFQSLTISVHAASPTIPPLPDQTTYVDHPILVELLVSDAETPTNLLSLKLSTSNPALVDTNKNVVFRFFTDGGSGVLPRWYMTLAPTFGLTGTATNTVTVSDGANTASSTFVLTVIPPPTNAARFANTNQITLPTNGIASQYPSTVAVSGMVGTITNVVVTLSHLTHTNANDLHMLLVSPTGRGMVFWSKVGGGGPFGGTPPDHHVTNVTATVTDDAPDFSPLPDFYYIWTEKFRPADYAAIEAPANNFPAPAPAGPYAPVPTTNAFHEAFAGLNANGTWSLYIYDDASPYAGKIDGGWSLTVSTTGPQSPTITDIADQTTLTNTPTAALAFTINDSDTPVGSLTLSNASSNPALVPTNNIVFGGSGSNRTVTVTPVGGLTGTATISVFVSDGTNSASDTFLLTVLTAPPQIFSFTNTAAITIRDSTNALPYPSAINVSGLSGTVSNVTLTLRSLSHQWGRDIDALLVGPGGQKVMFMSDAGTTPTATNANFTFSDGAASYLPATGSLVGGTYKPTDLEQGETMTAPAPAGPYATNFAAFTGQVPNGTWSLYVVDDGSGDTGSIAGGWSLTITMQPGAASNTPPTLSGISNQVTVVNTATAALPFTISDAETASSNLVLSVFTSNAGLVPTNQIVLGGSGTNRTVTVTPTSNQLGSATISLNVSDGTLIASNSFVLTVNPAVLTVTANSASRGYGLTNPVLNGSIVGLQAGDNITASFSSTAATNSPVGAYAITFTLSDPGSKLGNYVITTNNGTLTVTNALLSVTATSTNKIYGALRTFAGTEFTITSGTLYNGNTLTNVTLASGGTNATASVGSYVISVTNASGPGSSNYLISYVTGTLSVNAANLLVTAANTNKIYGTTLNPTLYTVSGLLNADTVTNVTLLSSGSVSNAAVGSYTINASAALGVGLTNYNIGYSNGTLTVNAANLLVTAGSTNKVYGSTLNPSGFAVVGLLNGDSVTNVALVSAGSVSNAPVGSYTINSSAAQGLGLTNYAIGYSNGTLTVNAASLLITAANTNKVYGATLSPTVFAVTGLLNSDTVSNVTLTSSGSVSNAPVGGYAINASGASGAGLTNYTIGYSNGTLTVGAANLLIAVGSTNKIYGTTLAPVSYTLTGLLNSDSVTNITLSSLGSVSNAAVGSYAINASGASGLGLTNYAIGYSNGTLTVGAANVLIVAGSTNKVYGTTLNPVVYSVSGLLNGDTVTNVTLSSLGSVSNAPVASYPISASAALGVGLTNYNIGYSNGTLTVNAANLLVTAGSTNKVYGSTLNPSGFAVAGLLNSDNVTNVTLTSGGSVSNASVGGYVISASGASGPGLTNYIIGYSNGTLTVNAAILMVSADNKSRNYGQPNPVLTLGFTGLVNGEGTNVLDALPSASTVATNTTAPGGYPITVVGGADVNYSFSFVPGVLTILSAANVTITTIEILDPDHVRIAGTGDANVIYTVQQSSNLVSWDTLGTATANESGAFEFVDATAGMATQRFYRLVYP